MPVPAALTAPSHLGGGQPSRGAEVPPAQPCWGPAAPQQSWLGCHPLLLVYPVPRLGLAAPGPSSSPSPSSSSSRDPLHSPPGQGEEGMRRRQWQPPPAQPTSAVAGGLSPWGGDGGRPGAPPSSPHHPGCPGYPWWGESTAHGLSGGWGRPSGSGWQGAMRSARQRHAGASAAPAGCCGLGRRPHTAPEDGGAWSAPETPPGAWQGEQGWAACLQLTMRQGERFSLTSRSSARRSISSQGSRAAATSCLFASLGHGEKAGSHPWHPAAPCGGDWLLSPSLAVVG